MIVSFPSDWARAAAVAPVPPAKTNWSAPPAARQRIRALPAGQRIVARAAHEGVGARATGQRKIGDDFGQRIQAFRIRRGGQADRGLKSENGIERRNRDPHRRRLILGRDRHLRNGIVRAG